ncbi:MAG TPA: tetratricopeptide repeat protein, partial [Myxococcales bacterium]|nr:tetratricopeptide repeat protein [Myxococcales bacterium]
MAQDPKAEASPTVELSVDIEEELRSAEPTLRVAVNTAEASPPTEKTDRFISPEAEARALLATYEREARARGNSPSAAALYFEMGRLWERQLGSPREAAACYQNAYRLDPMHRPNLTAARRLFSQVGNWQMTLQLVDAELAAQPTAQEGRALRLEKARLLASRLDRPQEASALLVQLCDEDPKDLAAAAALEGLQLTLGDAGSLAHAYQRQAEAASEPSLQVYCLTAAASLCEDALGHPDDAAELYRRAYAILPTDAAALAGVKAHAERQGHWEELYQALRTEAVSARGSTAAALLYQAAQICSERLDREPEALQALVEARRAAPGDPLILGELTRLYEQKGLFQDLADVLKARVATCRSPQEAVEVQLRLGALYEERLDQEEAAIAAYRAVVDLAPGQTAALAALGKLYHRRGQWPELLATYEAEIAATKDSRQRAAKLYKSAEILEEKLGKPEAAIARYNEVLLSHPGYLPAQKALTRLYEKNGKIGELCEMYEREISATRDRDQRIALWTQVAQLADERLSDVDRAVRAYLAIIEEAPDHLPTIRALARLCERAQRWRELIWAHELEAGLAGDQKQVISLLHRNCEILEEFIGDKDAAIEAYRKVLSLSPSYLPALKALGRLLAQKGRWEELAAMYRQEAEVAVSAEETAPLVYKIGELLENKLGREEQAIAAYREVLTVMPHHLPALGALQRIYRSRRQWEALTDVLRTEAAARVAPEEKAPILFHLGEVAERHLGRADLAVDAYQEVLRLVPTHALALRVLDRLYSAANAWRELCAIYERVLVTTSAGPARAASYLKLGRLYGDRLGDLSRAAECFEAALSGDPDPTTALLALKGLDRIHGAQGDRCSRAQDRERLASRLQDHEIAASLALLAGEDREDSAVGRTSPDLQAADRAAALADYQRAYTLNPDSPRIEAGFEEALRREKNWPGLVDLLRRRLERSSSPASRAETALELAEIHLRQGDRDKALAACRAGLETDATSLPLLRLVASLCLEKEDFAGAREALLTEGEALHEPALAVEALCAAAQISGRLGETAHEIAIYRKVLERDPLHREAADRLGRLLSASGDAAAFLELQERQAMTLAAQGDAAGPDRLLEVARRILDQLSDLPRALKLLDRALAVRPDDPAVLFARGEVLAKLSRPEEAAESYRRTAELRSDPAGQAEAHLRLGALLHEQLADPDRAVAHLQAAVAAGTGPAYVPALERLARLHEASGNWASGAHVLDLLEAANPEPPTLARALLLHARILLDGLGDGVHALEKCRRAHSLLMEDAQALSVLCALEQRLRDWEGAAATCERLAALTAKTDPAASRSFRMRAGEICVQELRRPQDAIANYRRALEVDPGDVTIRALLADLYATDPNHLLDAVAEHRWLLAADPARAESYRSLFRIFEAQRQADRAYCAAAVLTFLQLADEEVVTAHNEARKLLPAEPAGAIPLDQLDRLLTHIDGRGFLTPVLRILAECAGKVAPWPAERFSLARGDRLKPDHPVRRLVDDIAGRLAAPEVEVYQGKAFELLALPTAPVSLVVGAQVIRRFQDREQRFLLARLLARARDGSAVAAFVEPAWLCDFVGAALRLVQPASKVCGRPNEELEKKVGKAISRKGRRALEELAPSLTRPAPEGGLLWARSLAYSADRAGLALAGDVCASLTAAAAVDGAKELAGGVTAEAIAAAVRGQP